MSSKSSGSIVKSVESVVKSVMPKNMNMKHVLLAVLVGLLLCMLMGNTVEGLNMFTESTGTGGSAVFEASGEPVTGFCRTSSSSLMERECIPSTESTSADGLSAEQIQAMNTVCSSSDVSIVGGCTGTSSVPGERSGPFIVQKMRDTNGVLNPESDNLTCELGGEVDECAKAAFNEGPNADDQCTSDAGKALGCVWEACDFRGDNTMMLGADNSDPDNASIVLDLKDPVLTEYDRWRRCLFKNKIAKLEGDGALPVPDNLKTGEFPTYATVGALWNEPPTQASGPSAEPTSPINNLDGWVKGHAGYPRTKPAMESTELTPEVLRSINAIPMTKDGDIPPNLVDYLPDKWKTGFKNMYNYCKSENPNGYAAIGWSPDFRSLQCLNYNPGHKTINITTQKTRHPCGGCLGDCIDGKDYRLDPPNKAASIVNCDAPLGERAVDMAKLATLGNFAAIKEGGTEIATNLLKGLIS